MTQKAVPLHNGQQTSSGKKLWRLMISSYVDASPQTNNNTPVVQQFVSVNNLKLGLYRSNYVNHRSTYNLTVHKLYSQLITFKTAYIHFESMFIIYHVSPYVYRHTLHNPRSNGSVVRHQTRTYWFRLYVMLCHILHNQIQGTFLRNATSISWLLQIVELV
jgi:hypothetical protein